MAMCMCIYIYIYVTPPKNGDSDLSLFEQIGWEPGDEFAEMVWKARGMDKSCQRMWNQMRYQLC